jgi:hypothetical protein
VSEAGRREANTFLLQLEWDDNNRPTGSVQFGDEPPELVCGWLGLMAQLVRHMPEAEAAQK